MSFFGRIKSWFVTTEHDVVNFAQKVWNEVPVISKEIRNVATWITTKGLPTLTTSVQAITPFISLIGIETKNPDLINSIADLQKAIAGVQAFANTVQTGVVTADNVVQGYSDLKAAEAASLVVVATASKIIAATPSVNPEVNKEEVKV